MLSASFAANYTRLANSDLLAGYTITGTGDVLEVSRTYEDHRNLITAVEHAVDSTLISRYTYANNEIGHRTHVVNQGSAFADVGDAMNFYGYNTRGEVTNAVRRWGNNPNNPGATVAGQTFGYDYDPIGNRTWSKRGDYAREYAANELNQMTSRGVPGVAHLLGSADESATVTVNSQSVTRQDAYWYKDLAVTNDTAPQYPEVVIDATWSNILSSVTGNVFVAQTPEDFGYDGDGNMTNDGRFAYTWDGENRLIAVETLPAVVAASGAPQVRVEYAYDHMSRRIGKAVLNAYTNGTYTATNQTAYVYDGWNLIAETINNQTSTITNHYVWGLDLSGTLQGAGGIGGLLSATLGGTTSVSSVFFTADANGNIGQLLDDANPTNILAHYEYSPFGETLVAVGDLAKANPFRFSTKYHEDESGLVYYGYRYYKPDIGRWVNRDPLFDPGSPPTMLLNQMICRRLNSYAVLCTIIMMDNNRPTDVRIDALQEYMHIRNVIGKILNNEPFLWMSLAGDNLYSFSNNNSLNSVDWWGLMARRPVGPSIEDYGRAEYQRRAEPQPTDDYREVVENAWESIPVIGALARRVRELYAGASRELGTTVPSSQQIGDGCQDESYYQVGTDSIDGTPIMIRDLD